MNEHNSLTLPVHSVVFETKNCKQARFGSLILYMSLEWAKNCIPSGIHFFYWYNFSKSEIFTQKHFVVKWKRTCSLFNVSLYLKSNMSLLLAMLFLPRVKQICGSMLLCYPEWNILLHLWVENNGFSRCLPEMFPVGCLFSALSATTLVNYWYGVCLMLPLKRHAMLICCWALAWAGLVMLAFLVDRGSCNDDDSHTCESRSKLLW